MKKTITRVIFISFVFVWTSMTGQTIINKAQKWLSNNTQQQAQLVNISKPQLPNSIFQNFNSFLNKIGKQNSSSKASKAVSQANTITVTGNNRLALPSIASLGTDKIEKIVWNKESGTPRLIEMKALSNPNQSKVFSATDKEELAKKFFAENKSLLKIVDPKSELLLTESKADELNFTNLRFSQVYKGLEVWGKEFLVHFDSKGNLVSANGILEKTPENINDFNGNISHYDAVQISIKEIEKENKIVPVPQKAASILDYKEPIYKKVIWYDENKIPHLVWVVEVRSGLSQDWFYFVDANDGKVLNSYNAVCYDGITTGTGVDLNGVQRTFGTYQVCNDYFLIDASQPMFNAAQSKIPDSPVGAIVALDLRNKDLSNNSSLYYVNSNNNQWNDATAVSAHYNGIVTYKYFLSTYNRNSVDDKGMTIYSIAIE